MKNVRMIRLIATLLLVITLVLPGCSSSTSSKSTGATDSQSQVAVSDSSTTTLPETSASTEDVAPGITDFLDINTDLVTLIALGNSDVPVGQYSQEILTTLEIWDAIQSKISFCGNVKEVLSQVANGSVDCGIVYATDAATEPAVTVVSVAPSDLLTTPVVYPSAILTFAANPNAAEAFLNFLLTDAAKAAFEEVGFTTIADSEAHAITFAPEGILTIFAAASMTESLTAISDLFMTEYPDVEVIINFDSSGTLRTQIESGAEVDIFISAAQSPMTALIDGGYIDITTKINLLQNEVVLIIPGA
ncbi:MAG: molybdate ABC transporter substrate-binding protein [Clostridiales bacterium]|nr:molybdate ABC transporter substrate-binding protein [Clostridiales bacterium]